MSSDGHGSVPRFNEKGEMVGLGVGGVACNLKEVKRLVQEMNVPMTTALSVVTANVAKALQLPGKGFVKAGGSADLNLFDEDLNLVHVFAKGRQMMREGEIIVKGTFEE